MDFCVRDKQGKVLSCQDNSINADILRQSQGILQISVQIPIIEVASVWYPTLLAIPPVKLPWVAEFCCGINNAYPFFAFLNQQGTVSTAVGLTNCIDDCRASAKINQELGCYEVNFIIAVTPETEPFAIFFDQSGRTLVEVMQSYRDLVMPAVPVYPAGAWSPVYCSWYAVHTALTEEYLLENGRIAADLGFGTFIVDDGWCLDENKRVTPLTLPDWYRDIGDWQWSREKLPQLAEVVKKSQQTGLNYMFWVAPFFAGRRSGLAGKVSKYLTELHEGQRVFDPADETAAEITRESICNIFREMDLDGVKIDFIDTVIPDPEQPHCRAVRSYLEKLIGQIRADKPEALIEFRQNYGTPVNAHLATAFRAGDVPFDYMENFSRSLQLRLHLGDGIPVHADPVYFNSGESIDAVGRHMIAALAGVPMISMELRSLKKEHYSVIENYISFYNQNRNLLNFGHWTIEIRNGFAAWAKCENAQHTVMILTDAALLELACRQCSTPVTILNLTPETLECGRGRAFDAQGRQCNTAAPGGGRLELD